jgi:phosphoribosylaminoimidazolecarboxamide formyltransferase / IMP cyclohydrolase
MDPCDGQTGIIEFAQKLQAFGVEVLSRGGTAAQLRESGVPVMDVSEYTGFPERMGRILKVSQILN